MSGEPSPKRQRTESDDKPVVDAEQAAKIQKVLDAVATIEEELEQQNVKLAKEVLKIETKYNKAKSPVFAKRAKLLKDIPHFWKQALSNHPIIGNLITDEEAPILDHIETLDIKFTDDLGSFTIELTLSENPYLSSTALYKQITFMDDDEAEPEIKAAPLAWKDTDEAKAVQAESSFFDWFASTDGMQDVAEIIKDDLFKSPVQYYMDDGDDEDEDGEEGESDDDEDGEGEDGEGEDGEADE